MHPQILHGFMHQNQSSVQTCSKFSPGLDLIKSIHVPIHGFRVRSRLKIRAFTVLVKISIDVDDRNGDDARIATLWPHPTD
jgi:hypothetical protein